MVFRSCSSVFKNDGIVFKTTYTYGLFKTLSAIEFQHLDIASRISSSPDRSISIKEQVALTIANMKKKTEDQLLKEVCLKVDPKGLNGNRIILVDVQCRILCSCLLPLMIKEPNMRLILINCELGYMDLSTKAARCLSYLGIFECSRIHLFMSSVYREREDFINMSYIRKRASYYERD